MSFAPQQDWDAYQALTASHQQQYAQSRTVEQRFLIYEDLYQLVCDRNKETGDWDRLERTRWEQKLALRTRLVAAFAALDNLRRE